MYQDELLRVQAAFGGLALAGGGRTASATSQRCLGLRVLAGRKAQPDCIGALRLQAEAAGTVVTWFYQAARATALSFAVAGLPLFTWPGAPRRATRTSPSPSKPVRPLVKARSGGLWGAAVGRSTWRGASWWFGAMVVQKLTQQPVGAMKAGRGVAEMAGEGMRFRRVAAGFGGLRRGILTAAAVKHDALRAMRRGGRARARRRGVRADVLDDGRHRSDVGLHAHAASVRRQSALAVCARGADDGVRTLERQGRELAGMVDRVVGSGGVRDRSGGADDERR